MTKKKSLYYIGPRAATMEITGPYHSVLQDVELAFKYGYPKEMYFKVGPKLACFANNEK